MSPESLAGATPQQPQALTPLQAHQQQIEYAALGEMHDVLVRLNINAKNFSVETRARLVQYVTQMGKVIQDSFGGGGNA